MRNWISKLLKSLAKVPNWSSLRALGQSRLLALTMLVPFLGWLIIFNSQIVDFLKITSQFFPIQADGPDPAARYTVSRLVFLYFGLLFVGTASIVFSVFCPPEVRAARTRNEYITIERDLLTEPGLQVRLSDVCADYLAHQSEHGEYASPPMNLVRYPASVAQHFAVFIVQLWTKMAAADPTGNTTDDPSNYPDLYTLNGRLNIENVAEILWMQRRLEEGLWSALQAQAREFDRDILALRYDVANHSKPWIRFSIVCLYGLGFIVLSIPTIETALRILYRIFA